MKNNTLKRDYIYFPWNKTLIHTVNEKISMKLEPIEIKNNNRK